MKFSICLVRPSVLMVLLAGLSLPALSQDNETPEQMKKTILELVQQGKQIQALPLLEKIVVLEPDNYEMHFDLAMSLLAQTTVTQDETEQKALRIRARSEFILAKQKGDQHPIVDAIIQGIAADGSNATSFSKNKDVEAIMDEAEAYFSRGQLDEALKDYQKALLLDPKLYEAAVFCGDVYVHNGDWEQAEVWYQKAIAIDPNKEKAYRYSATPFMKQRKYDMARDRYVEAYITEPYSSFSRAGLSQWSGVTHSPVGHPKIDFPTNVTSDEKGDTKINLDASMLLGGKDDGSFAWIVYGGTRSLWRKEKFAQAFPAEKNYRHSLNEEVDALRSVLAVVKGEKKVKKLSPSLAKLKELNDKGFLEAYILLAMADEGIAADFPKYLEQHRDQLRRYVIEYVVSNQNQ